VTALGLAALAAAGPTARDAPALAAMVRNAVAAGVSRNALHLRLSRLPGRLVRDHHRRLVQDALEPVLRPRHAGLYELPNDDLVVVTTSDGALLDRARESVATLLADDIAGEACQLLRLPEQAAALLALIEAALAPAPQAEGLTDGGGCFASAALAEAERTLATASMDALLISRPVCRLLPEASRPELAWEERRIDWAALRAACFPEADPFAAPWLQRRLQRLLDRRRLADLAHPADLLVMRRLGLPLAVASLTEAAFLRFDSMLKQEGRASITIGLAAADVLADPESFAFARDFVRARGYRLALDEAEGVTALLLPAERIGVDVVRLRWSPGLPGLGRGLAAALPAGPERVVLTGVDRASGIGWGWEHGITLFEGPLLTPRGRG
jgi:hypothetical protein